ncbi:MAG: adenylosuccinate synthase [candidate division Zixibacteria bacterium]|nr:adenylosuccinate synthase [candidate division Zixibacteria bacterium]
MPCKVVLGCQWGDEGKGKIVDILAEDAELIVRFQGGANAGHTVVIGNKTFILHLLPSGILRPGKKCIISTGVVVDPQQLVNEINETERAGLCVRDRLYISGRANVVFPFHKFLDNYYENLLGGMSIGTTGRGIGPTYTDRSARTGIRMYDLLDKDRLSERLKHTLKLKCDSIKSVSSAKEFDIDYNIQSMEKPIVSLKDCITDTSKMISDGISSRKSILFEGAQGTLLDVDYGTFPYTTSSNTITGGFFTGCGIAPFMPDEIIGVVKAYTTRVGEGPFPTEITDDSGEVLREKGGEFGATTGRPRRCGWLDLVALRYTCRLNGVNALVITKLDVLDNYDEIKVCNSYKYGDKILNEFPDDYSILPECEPVYEQLSGWEKPVTGISNPQELTGDALKYIKFIESNLGIKAKYIATGPSREHTIVIPQ